MFMVFAMMLCVSAFANGSIEPTKSATEELKTRYFVGSNGKYGIIDDNFNVIIPAEYQFAYEFTGEVANVQIDDKTWGFVNKDNELVFSLKADMLNPLIDGWAKYETANNKYGFVNQKGEYLVKDYDWVCPFSEGYGSVKKNDVCIYIDTEGVGVFPHLELDWGYSFEDGYAVVIKNKKYGVINHDGDFVIPCDYVFVDYEQELYWSVMDPEDNTQCFMLNEHGERVGKTIFKTCGKVYNDKCIMHYKGEPFDVSRVYDIKADTVSDIKENWSYWNSYKNILYRGCGQILGHFMQSN